ncbi:MULTISPECIES: GNAT family N-acetyltransferase [unclassified Desulfurobacterium]|uniref:GNAT family N-acetyltransferase n=1 Tax=unclassified Desulfurobacterium TaxID=2639089 RepID=UPI0003B4FA95|nr:MULTISPECIES: GNAT family N-acetyltransferase [unclassified Desulfurobacterium]
MEPEIVGEKIVLKLGEEEAFVKFKIEQNIIMVTTTYVPESHRGKGIAGKLNAKLVEMAKEKRMKIYPLCEYTRKYLERKQLHELIYE